MNVVKCNMICGINILMKYFMFGILPMTKSYLRSDLFRFPLLFIGLLRILDIGRGGGAGGTEEATCCEDDWLEAWELVVTEAIVDDGICNTDSGRWRSLIDSEGIDFTVSSKLGFLVNKFWIVKLSSVSASAMVVRLGSATFLLLSFVIFRRLVRSCN